MAFDNSTPVKPILFDGLDMIFDERQSTILSMRKVQWCKEGEEPEESRAKLELRKWRIQPDGTERADKGFAFLTENGPHDLAKGLIHEGYGNTKEILQELVKRDDFKDAVDHFGDDNESSSGEYFDMRDLLKNISVGDDEDGVA